MLVAKNLVKTFEKNEKHKKKISFNAVDDISLEIKRGEIVGVLGPNGAGKTTLLRMLGKLMEPTSGDVILSMDDGSDEIKDVQDIKKCIGYLSGNTRLYGRLSTRELLTMLGTVYGIDSTTIEKRIGKISHTLDMSEFIDNRIEKLSTGQTQRASIARCLIHDPDIYIFDEPTLGLDILSSSAIVEFMKAERDRGKSVIYSTHYMEEAAYLCDRIILINHGKIVGQGTLEELCRVAGKDDLRGVFKELVGVKNAIAEQ